MSELKTRASIHIKGKVQGVFFRVNAREMALSLSITGWIKNNPDGTISVIVEGPKDLVKKFIEWCKIGPSMAEITDVQIQWEQPTGKYSKFEIRS